MRIDAHSHVRGENGQLDVAFCDRLMEAADQLHIDQMWCSLPIPNRIPEPEEVRACNDCVLQAMQHYPRRISGLCFVVPGWFQAALDEIDRCMAQGMIGIKLYNQYFVDDPTVFPIIEKAIDLAVPVLCHAGHPTDALTRRQQPKISDGCHFAALARRYPQAMLIMAHIGGGGDWEWSLQAIAESPSVYADTSGSVIDDGMIEYAMRLLGVERLLFACDLTQEGGVGKILAADLTEEQRERIFWRNAAGILQRRRTKET